MLFKRQNFTESVYAMLEIAKEAVEPIEVVT